MSSERLRASLAVRYRIERELGAGGMATVYLAQDLKHDRKVAVTFTLEPWHWRHPAFTAAGPPTTVPR